MQCSVGARLVPTPQSPLTVTLPNNGPVKSATTFSAIPPFVEVFVMIKLPGGPSVPRLKGEPVTVIVAAPMEMDAVTVFVFVPVMGNDVCATG